MCRALKVLCVAPDDEALSALMRAAVSAEWELVRGATDEDEALRRLEQEGPHIAVVFGPFDGFVARALDAAPSLRVVSDHDVEGAAVVVRSLDEVRDAVLSRRREP